MMDLNEALSQSLIIPEENKNALRKNLRNLPQNMEKWFFASSLSRTFLQGDIFDNVPIIKCYLNNKNTKKKGYSYREKLSKVIILTNSCDMENNKSPFITVAPLGKGDSEVLLRAGLSHDLINNIKKNLITQLMYLPSLSNNLLGESIVHLNKLASIPAKSFHNKRARKIATLSPNGHYLFLVKLSWHFVRP